MLAFSFLSEAFAGHTVVTADRHRSSPPRRDPEEEEDRFVAYLSESTKCPFPCVL